MDTTLVEAAQGGDRDAYEQLARGVARQLYLVASRILQNPDAAEDAVQQTLVTIWRDLRSLRDPARFEAWAYRIVVRTCRAESRTRRRRGITLTDISDSLPDVRDPIGEAQLREELRVAFERLTVDQRTVIVLHHLVGLPLAEIAEILAIPYGTVGSRLHHAVAAMRVAMAAPDVAITGGQLA